MSKYSLPLSPRKFSLGSLSPRSLPQASEILTPREELAIQVENLMRRFLEERLNECVVKEKQDKKTVVVLRTAHFMEANPSQSINGDEPKIIDWTGKRVEDHIDLSRTPLGKAESLVLTRISQAVGAEVQEHADNRKKPLSKADMLNLRVLRVFGEAQEEKKGRSSTIKTILHDRGVNETLEELVVAAVDKPEQFNNILMAVQSLHAKTGETQSRIVQKGKGFQGILEEEIARKFSPVVLEDAYNKDLIAEVVHRIDALHPIAIADPASMKEVAEHLVGYMFDALTSVKKDSVSVEERASEIVSYNEDMLLRNEISSLHKCKDYLESGLFVSEGWSANGKSMDSEYVSKSLLDLAPVLGRSQWCQWLLEPVEGRDPNRVAVVGLLSDLLQQNFSEIRFDEKTKKALGFFREGLCDLCKKDIDYSQKGAIREAAEGLLGKEVLAKLFELKQDVYLQPDQDFTPEKKLRRNTSTIQLQSVLARKESDLSIGFSDSSSSSNSVDELSVSPQSSPEVQKIPVGQPVGLKPRKLRSLPPVPQKKPSMSPEEDISIVGSLLRKVPSGELPQRVQDERKDQPWTNRLKEQAKGKVTNSVSGIVD